MKKGKVLKALLGSFVIAFSMYSRIPMPMVEWTKERMRYVMCFFPLIGAVIGILEALLGLLCYKLGFPVFGAVLPVVLPIAVTGGIHMDGLLDVIDARASQGDKEKKLAILKDPHTGAFAIIGCSVYLLIYLAAFGELGAALFPSWCAGFVITRALSGLAVVSFPMAKKSGLAAAFGEGARKKTVGLVMIAYLAAAYGFIWYQAGPLAGGMVLLVSLLVYFITYRMAKREFGGITGDVAGYLLQMCELSLTLTLAVLSHF